MDLKLFCMEGCPYCMKVIRYIEKNNISVELADVRKAPKNQEDFNCISIKVPSLFSS